MARSRAPSLFRRSIRRRVYEQDGPKIALIVDNSDNFMSSTLEDSMTTLTDALNQPDIQPRLLQQTALDVVELYPYIEYMKFLLPGSISLAMFVSAMIGGGMLYIDDKARGVHEGYLVTPITKTELVFGLNGAGAIKGILTGIVITMIGSLLAGVGHHFQSGNYPRIASDDRGYGDRLQYDDVPDDGTRRRSARTTSHFRNSEHLAVFPKRVYLSNSGFSTMVAGDRNR
jgi:hypothetical protein